MLKMKKNFIGLALSTAMGLALVGCQTAPKGVVLTDADDFLNIPGYGDNYVDGRSPAGVGEIGAEVFKVLSRLPKKDVIKGVEKDFSIAYLNYVGRAARKSEDSTVKRIVAEAAERNKQLRAKGKKPKSELSIEDIKKLPEEMQARLSAEFLRSEGLADLPALNALRNKLDIKISQMGGSDMYRMKQNSLLTEKQLLTQNINAKVNQNAAFKGVSETGRKLNDKLDELLAAKSVTPEQVVEFRKVNGKYYKYSRGELSAQPNGCDMFAGEGGGEVMESYNRMMRDVLEEIEGGKSKSNLNADGTLRCKNAGEITAYALANYQVKLGRPGPSALFAVKELCECGAVSCPAAQRAAEIKDLSRKPACE